MCSRPHDRPRDSREENHRTAVAQTHALSRSCVPKRALKRPGGMLTRAERWPRPSSTACLARKSETLFLQQHASGNLPPASHGCQLPVTLSPGIRLLVSITCNYARAFYSRLSGEPIVFLRVSLPGSPWRNRSACRARFPKCFYGFAALAALSVRSPNDLRSGRNRHGCDRGPGILLRILHVLRLTGPNP